jgi:hypothetical protein
VNLGRVLSSQHPWDNSFVVCRWGGGSNSEGWRAGTMTACDDEIGLRTTKQQPTNERRRGGSGSGGGSATARGRRQLGGGSAVAAAQKRDVGGSLAAARPWRQRDSATFVSLLRRRVAHLAMITGDDNRDSNGTDRATIATSRGRIATTCGNQKIMGGVAGISTTMPWTSSSLIRRGRMDGGGGGR